MAIVTVADLEIAYDEVGEGVPVLMMNEIGADRTACHLQTPTIVREGRVITYEDGAKRSIVERQRNEQAARRKP